MIYQVKRAGINQTYLIGKYESVIRYVVEYACPVWHTKLPKYLSDIIQNRCLKAIMSTLYVREYPADGKLANVAQQTRISLK